MAHFMQDRIQAADRSVAATSRPVPTVATGATLNEALRVFLDSGSEYLVVVAPDGRFAGVLGGRQLVAAWVGSPEAFAATPVTAVLDPVPATVAPTATVRTVARVMRDYGSDVVVVIGQGRAPIGVVTAGDVAATIAEGPVRAARGPSAA